MPRFEQGQEIDGRYRLIAKVGAGGMADVWAADDMELQRKVALKFLHERFAEDRQFVDRFEREARSAAALQHPNIVGVYDRGEWEGTHYIVMEFVDGATLADLIARGLGIGEAVEITRQILAGARYAHEHGIVHRDLKPGNVLVDAEGRARVTDFGIARAGASAITQTGSVLGTAHYLSPEQAQGLDVTASSDIYSIGVILYEALTGRIPFEGDSAVTIALKQVSEQPRPPSELNPNVSKALDAIVLRALAKDPRNRFASAAEFIQALDSAEADPTGGGLGDTASYAAVAAAAGAALAAGAGPEAAMAREQEAAHQGENGGGWMTRRRALIIGAILLLLGGAAAFALTRAETVTVPNVLEKNADEARALLEGKGFDVDALPRTSCNERDTVIEQDPLAGADADEGSTVSITVSTGSQVAVPKVIGLPLAKARSRLERSELLVKSQSRFANRGKPGTVIGSNPGEGSNVECQSTVKLLVSKGANLVDLPNLLGQQQSEAEATLEGLGLIPDIEERNSDAPAGQVIGQAPGPGQVKKGSTVKLTVSNGAGTVIMPNVVGQSKEAAIANLRSQGLSITVIKQPTENESEDDVVLDQAPETGTRLRAGESVTIYVGVFKAPVEPPTDEETPKAGA